jgi:hypothetical protein
MSLTRALNKLICRVLIGVVLFAQFAVASYACPSAHAMGGASSAYQMATDAGDGMSNSYDDLDHQSPNLCAEHCKVGQQTTDTSPAPAISAPAQDVLYIVSQSIDAGTEGQPAVVPDPLLAVPPPPHAILHCVFRT